MYSSNGNLTSRLRQAPYGACLAAHRNDVRYEHHSFSPLLKKTYFTATGKVTDRRVKSQGYTSEASLFCFLAELRP